jgi:hypothetical protein
VVIETDGLKEIDIDFTQVCRIVDHIRENSELEIKSNDAKNWAEWYCPILGIPLVLRKDMSRDPPELDIYVLSEGTEWSILFHFSRKWYGGSFSIQGRDGFIVVEKSVFSGSFERFQTVFMIAKMAGS